MSAARAASHTRVRPRKAFGGGGETLLARRGVLIGDKDDIMPVLAGEPFDPVVPKIADPLTTLFADDFASGGDIGRNLRNICGVLAERGLNRCYPLADLAKEVLIAVALSALPSPACSLNRSAAKSAISLTTMCRNGVLRQYA